MPAAELEITADLVRRLLAAQQPDLAGLPVEPLANGWDNTLFRLGDDLVARLPRRTLGASIVVNEQRWLPLLDLFRGAYAAAGNGPVTDATWTRGRGWALNLAVVFLAWSADNPRLHAVGRRTLAAVLARLAEGVVAGRFSLVPRVRHRIGN
jgi:aminoglycoside phosphotransferase (APT) family kinase protein